MNYCQEGGYLVDATRPLPENPSVFYAGGQIAGCNRIRCSQCKAMVRNVIAKELPERMKPEEILAVYETADLASHPLMKKASKDFRQYLCRCRKFFETRYRALNDPDPEPFQAPNLPWECSGHPLVMSPHDFDGVVVKDEQGLVELVKAALAGRLPPKATAEDKVAATWLIGLHNRLAQTGLRQVVTETVNAALDNADPKVRGRALNYLFSVRDPGGMQTAFRLYDRKRQLFHGIPDEVTDVDVDKTLEDSLWRAIGPLTGAPGRPRDFARMEALIPGRGRHAVYSALALFDTEWFAQQIEAVFAATPSLGNDLIRIITARFPDTIPSGPVIAKLYALMGRTAPN